MSDIDDDVQFMLTRLAKLMMDDGITLTVHKERNRIIVDRPNAAEPGGVIIEFRGE